MAEYFVSIKNGTKIGSRNIFECDVCGKSFQQMYKLNFHKRSHSDVKPFVCDICTKGFTQLSHLKDHRQIHTSDQIYVCELCQKQFSQLRYIKRHQKLHLGEKPHQCEICEKRFNRLSHLNDHRQIHSLEKKYECDICQKKFAQMRYVNRHKKLHTNADLPQLSNSIITNAELSNSIITNVQISNCLDPLNLKLAHLYRENYLISKETKGIHSEGLLPLNCVDVKIEEGAEPLKSFEDEHKGITQGSVKEELEDSN